MPRAKHFLISYNYTVIKVSHSLVISVYGLHTFGLCKHTHTHTNIASPHYKMIFLRRARFTILHAFEDRYNMYVRLVQCTLYILAEMGANQPQPPAQKLVSVASKPT